MLVGVERVLIAILNRAVRKTSLERQHLMCCVGATLNLEVTVGLVHRALHTSLRLVFTKTLKRVRWDLISVCTHEEATTQRDGRSCLAPRTPETEKPKLTLSHCDSSTFVLGRHTVGLPRLHFCLSRSSVSSLCADSVWPPAESPKPWTLSGA